MQQYTCSKYKLKAGHPHAAKVFTQPKALQVCTPLRPVVLPKAAMDICTPLHLDRWRELLKCHPDKELTSYIAKRIVQGFCIGCNRSKVKLHTCKHNLLSTSIHML